MFYKFPLNSTKQFIKGVYQYPSSANKDLLINNDYNKNDQNKFDFQKSKLTSPNLNFKQGNSNIQVETEPLKTYNDKKNHLY